MCDIIMPFIHVDLTQRAANLLFLIAENYEALKDHSNAIQAYRRALDKYDDKSAKVWHGVIAS